MTLFSAVNGARDQNLESSQVKKENCFRCFGEAAENQTQMFKKIITSKIKS